MGLIQEGIDDIKKATLYTTKIKPDIGYYITSDAL